MSPGSRLRAYAVAGLCRAVSRDRASQRGAVIALVAVGLVALFGAVGLAIDGSRMLEERRHAQAAADNAATAAAYNRCAVTGSSEATARAAGFAAALVNGFDDASPRVIVQVDPVGTPSTSTEWRSIVTSTIDGTFARVLGFSTFDVSATARSSGSGCGATASVANPGAIYAGGICTVSGKYGVDISGSSSQVYGGLHSNDDVSVGGSGNIFWEPPTPPDDPFTYVGSINPAATANNTFQPGGVYPQQVPMPTPQWPAGWAPSDLTGGTGIPAAGSFLRPYYDLAINSATGTFSTNKITTINKDGVFYTTHADGIDIGSITTAGSVNNVVLIAPNGNVKVSASGPRTFNPYNHASLTRQGILIISNATRAADKTCEDPTVMVSGSNVTWNGIMWAVSGQIQFSGSLNTAATGSLVGHSVQLNGSNLVIRNNSSFFPGVTSPEITLQQ